jgi:hypothetical protein
MARSSERIVAVPDKERLELWRGDRDRLLRLIAGDSTDGNELHDVLQGDAIEIERFIRHYEKKAAGEAGNEEQALRLSPSRD